MIAKSIIRLFLFSFIFSAFSAQSQCAVQVTSSVVPTITCGESIDLTAYGTGGGPGLNVDFNGNTTSPGWANSFPLLYSNPCGPTLDGTPAAWFGQVGFPRTLTTNGYDVSCGGDVCFDFDFANDDPCGCTDCEDPDQINEGVYFQYSIDGGVNWVDIYYFEPNNANTGPNYTWTNHCFTIPPGAFSANTMFQWHQDDPTSADFDHWGIDNISITPLVCGNGYYYEWNGVLGDEDTTVTLTTTTNYDILFTNGIDDSCTTSILVEVLPFNVTANTNTTSLTCGDCANMFAQLLPQPQITGASYSIDWQPAGIMSAPNAMFTDACPPTDTMVYITISEATSGCSGIDSVFITVQNMDAGYFYASTVFCADDSNITPTITGDLGGVFSAPAGLQLDPVTGEVSPSLSLPGIYDVTYTPNPLCPTDSTITLTINALPTVDAGVDQAVCSGVQVTLNGSGAVNYTWDNGVLDGTAFTPMSTQVYTVTGTDANNCENTDQVSVQLLAADDPSFTYIAGVVYCLQDANPVADITGTLGGTFSYNLVSGGTNLALNTVSGDIDLGSSEVGQYEVIYNTTSAGLCPDSSSLTIVIHPMPDASFNADVLFGCEPQVVSFTENSTLLSQTCAWDFGNGTTSASCGPVNATYMAGMFDVTLSITSEAGCTSTETYIDYIDITAMPNASFLATPPVTNIEFTEIDFSNYSSDASTYYWTFGDTAQSSVEENPTYTYPEVPQVYTVTLTATSDDGLCSHTTSSEIIINDVLTFFIPNTFTPNGDSFNETFQPVFTSGFLSTGFHLYIFDRWGELIFESQDPTIGWDGHYGDGGLVPDGIYIWQVDFTSDSSDERFLHRGHVTVLK